MKTASVSRLKLFSASISTPEMISLFPCVTLLFPRRRAGTKALCQGKTLWNSAVIWQNLKRLSNTSKKPAMPCSTATTVLTMHGIGHIRLSTCRTTATSQKSSISRTSPMLRLSVPAVWILFSLLKKSQQVVSMQLPLPARTLLTPSGLIKSLLARKKTLSLASAATTAASTLQSTKAPQTSSPWKILCILPVAL